MTTSDSSETVNLLGRLHDGDPQALADLFARHRERLRRMVRLRLDRRLQGRVDPSDVLREAYGDVARHAADYCARPTMPFFLWLRLLTGQKLQALHQQYLGGRADAGQEVSLYRGALPQANSVSLAAQLLGRVTAASQAADRADKQIRLQEALNGMDPMDREVLALRHFEELSNSEAAEVMGVAKAVASNRYIGALKRLKEILNNMPGFFEA
ncbi:MAG TPA: sigma-70 family RNA polymerase sigma factor [Gemmataceae bacterium]|jgi:RNA polymerase sigma-70 factor (ECF subfamily)|nr:sigma-70 family RNA polymerase sigma factor [Gemmataceae bacterium]